MTKNYEDLPYRPCVGVMLINRKGLVFIGRRTEGPEHVDETHAWQMPQGGVDAGEDPWPAALRELYEETNVTSVEKLGESSGWLSYDIPRDIVGQAWKGKYRGQTQKWYALRFTGEESEIDVLNPCRRPQAGVCRMALGKNGTPAGPDHPVQAGDLRAGGRGVQGIRDAINSSSPRTRGPMNTAVCVSFSSLWLWVPALASLGRDDR
jgi:putative (di)nucleoside polyphosphate hydrolase